MTRVIEERWMEIGFDVITENLPMANPDGTPAADEHGHPLTEQFTTLVLIVNEPGVQRLIRIPFQENGRQLLLQKLTGGIIVPPSNGSAPHLPFGPGV